MVTLTDAAYHYIQKMIEKKQGIGFRLSIKKTGCSGYSYLPTVVETENIHDKMLKQNELTIWIDSQWLHFFEDIKIDYVEEEKAGLKQKKLIFVNPNEAHRCGC